MCWTHATISARAQHSEHLRLLQTHVLQQPPGAFDPNPLDEPAPSNKDDSDFGPEADEWEGFHHGLHPEGPLDDSDKSENEPDDSDDMQDKGGTEPSLAMSCSKSSQHKTAKPLPRDRASARHRLSSLAADPSVSRRGPRPVPLKTVVRGKRRPKRKQTSALELHSNPASPTALCTTDTSSASDADDRQTGPASSLTQHLPKTAIGSQVAQVVSPNRNTSKSVRKQKSDKPPKPNKRQSKSKSHDAIQSQQQQQQQQQPASDHRDILDDLDSDMDDPAGSAGPCAEAQKYWAAAAEISSFLDEISD